MGFLCGVERAIEDLYAAVGIRLIAVGPIRSESCADFFDVVRGGRLAFKIPSSKLNAHDLLSPYRSLSTSSPRRAFSKVAEIRSASTIPSEVLTMCWVISAQWVHSFEIRTIGDRATN